MRYASLRAELQPYPDGVVQRFRDVRRNIRLFVSGILTPAVLMRFAYEVTLWVSVVSAQVEAIDSSSAMVDEYVGKFAGRGVIASFNGKGVPCFRGHSCTKLHRRRIINIPLPRDIPLNPLGGVSQDCFKFLGIHQPTLQPPPPRAIARGLTERSRPCRNARSPRWCRPRRRSRPPRRALPASAPIRTHERCPRPAPPSSRPL